MDAPRVDAVQVAEPAKQVAPSPKQLEGYSEVKILEMPQAQVFAPRPGFGKAVELASAVLCPMKGSSVLEDYVMEGQLGEGSFGQVCVVTQRLTGQKRACKRVQVQSEMVRWINGGRRMDVSLRWI